MNYARCLSKGEVCLHHVPVGESEAQLWRLGWRADLPGRSCGLNLFACTSACSFTFPPLQPSHYLSCSYSESVLALLSTNNA